jgi:hypothetical protein
MTTIKVNSTRFRRDRRDSLYNNQNNKKYYKIFILTKDDYYFIVEKRKLYKSMFFKNIFDLDKTAGNINNPLFLKTKNSRQLKIIIEYLNFYYNKIDFYEKHKNISFNDIDVYFNNFDRNFFSRFHSYSIKELEEFIKIVSYYYIDSFSKKLELCLFFKKNINRIN